MLYAKKTVIYRAATTTPVLSLPLTFVGLLSFDPFQYNSIHCIGCQVNFAGISPNHNSRLKVIYMIQRKPQNSDEPLWASTW